MADVVLLTAREDADVALALGLELEGRGWSVELGEGDVATAGCVVVVWSRASRYDYRVGRAATTAQRAGKLLGLSLDATTPPYGYPPLEGKAWDVAAVVAAALRLGPVAYGLPVRARLALEVAAALRAVLTGPAVAVHRLARVAAPRRRDRPWWRRLGRR